ncbi:MAG: hypothetical protein PHW82_11035 [Bacteroidales bacterium]|nr:hypothetical protein [Bacteroidales bacterium]
MSNLKKECLFVSIFIAIVMLAYVGVPFAYVASLLALPIVIGLLIFLGVSTTTFQTEPMQVVLSIFYKIFFIIALFFMSNAYPGKYWFSAIALIIAVTYIIVVLVKNPKPDLFVTAIIYINLFCGFLVMMR